MSLLVSLPALLCSQIPGGMLNQDKLCVRMVGSYLLLGPEDTKNVSSNTQKVRERCRDTLHKGITPHPNPLPVEYLES